jgi:hypothetical protein
MAYRRRSYRKSRRPMRGRRRRMSSRPVQRNGFFPIGYRL